jgi:hypothetical protein
MKMVNWGMNWQLVPSVHEKLLPEKPIIHFNLPMKTAGNRSALPYSSPFSPILLTLSSFLPFLQLL